jgi:hypothetical protein
MICSSWIQDEENDDYLDLGKTPESLPMTSLNSLNGMSISPGFTKTWCMQQKIAKHLSSLYLWHPSFHSVQCRYLLSLARFDVCRRKWWLAKHLSNLYLWLNSSCVFSGFMRIANHHCPPDCRSSLTGSYQSEKMSTYITLDHGLPQFKVWCT